MRERGRIIRTVWIRFRSMALRQSSSVLSAYARAAAATADVVNQDINPAKGRDGGLDEPCRFIGCADIGRVSGYVHAARA